MNVRWLRLALGAGIAVAMSCSSEEPPSPAKGIFAPLGSPMPSATPEQLAAFERGREIALRRFTAEDGLGPEFNLTFCVGCHEKPALGGSASRYRDFLLVGEELEPGMVEPRGESGVQRQFSLESGRAPSDPSINISSTRNPISFFGAGLLDEIPELEILEYADPGDADGDGISGRANHDGMLVGKFGRKAQTARIELFVRGPLFNHVGITSNPLTQQQRDSLPSFKAPTTPATRESLNAFGPIAEKQAVIPDGDLVDDDGVPDPELADFELFDLICFAMLLAAPEPDEPSEQSERGRSLFADLGCDACHRPSLRGPRGTIPAYTDLLLHDMGDGLADGFPMGEATGREFRTQPLWGVVAVSPYLHDGRANTLDEAVRWHGGEAAATRDAYLLLSDDGREDLIAFLESLGGKAQRTSGLLPPGAPLAGDGEYGAALPDLDSTERALFEQGRLLFDRDFFSTEGVGPLFNGDACRSCHFDPVIGGAGPSGVDAMRQGSLDGLVFAEPSSGTALLRHAVAPVRPEADSEANFFEPRQTPTTLGLGLLERIPRETIESRADPEDENGDGIRGRAHVLADGRLGRFGWKANVPSVREFVRDALSGELGMTVPEEPGLSFGATEDGDMSPDPETDIDTIDALSGFIALLAPPPRNTSDPTIERAGEAIFERVGCTSCHVPSLGSVDGIQVAAYTDLLLHRVGAAESLGIEEGEAGIHDFRTPPLWGLGRSAPYLHDGRAATVADAVAAHEGEARGARLRVGELSESERGALFAFLRSL